MKVRSLFCLQFGKLLKINLPGIKCSSKYNWASWRQKHRAETGTVVDQLKMYSTACSFRKNIVNNGFSHFCSLFFLSSSFNRIHGVPQIKKYYSNCCWATTFFHRLWSLAMLAIWIGYNGCFLSPRRLLCLENIHSPNIWESRLIVQTSQITRLCNIIKWLKAVKHQWWTIS